MNLNSAALKVMAAKGLTLDDVAEIVAANEQTRDPTAAERMRNMRARRKGEKVTRNVTPVTPNDNNTLTPGSEAKASKPFDTVPDGVNPQHWADFRKNRKNKRCTDSETAYRGVLKDLAEISDDEWPPGRLVEYAAEKGWASINDPRKPKYGSPANERDNNPLATALQRINGAIDARG